MLAPLVRILLRNGIGWKEFAELSKEVYVDVARRDYGLQGRPTNLARVALMTGLSRREVGRLREVIEGSAEVPQSGTSRISQVLSAWHLDPEFSIEPGVAAPLPAAGARGSLDALLKRYGGDMPRGAFVKELLKLGLVEHEDGGYRALARDYVRQASDPDMLRQASIALADHGSTLAHNVNADRDSPPHLERMATNPSLARRHLAEFHAFSEQRGQALLEEIDAWLSTHAADSDSGREDGVRAGLGIYLIQDDTTRG